MLKLLPPPFPTRFSTDEVAGLDERNEDRAVEAVEWPGEETTAPGERRRGPKFSVVRNEREQYIEALEHKLDQLGGPGSSTLDSGYGSSYRHDRVENGGVSVDLVDDVILEDDVAYGSSEDEAKREGRPLLGSEPEDEDGDDEEQRDGSQVTPHESPSKQILIIPATPGEDDEGDQDQGEEAQGDVTQNRRISFSDSVRIGGGIRTSSRPHRHRRPAPPALTDVFGPPGLPRPSQRSTSLVSYTSSGPNSRSGSPSRPSAASAGLLREMSAAGGFLRQQPTGGAYSFYSSSPGSQIPSRSSSPCSSIYAPLQASKAHCPTPMSIQPPRRPRNATLTFRDYLNSRDGSESDEEVVRGYHELVAEQRHKRERWEQRRRRRQHQRASLSELEDPNEPPHLGFWSRVAELLALGAAGASGSSRGTITVNYGATAVNGVSGSLHTAQPPPRPKRVRSRLSISSDLEDTEEEDDEDEDEDEVAPHKHKKRSSQRPSRRQVVKTEMDIRFGLAPRRWLNWHWWVYKIGTLVMWLFTCFGARHGPRDNEMDRAAYEAL